MHFEFDVSPMIPQDGTVLIPHVREDVRGRQIFIFRWTPVDEDGEDVDVLRRPGITIIEPLPNSECSERKFEWIRIYKSC